MCDDKRVTSLAGKAPPINKEACQYSFVISVRLPTLR
jgi:hypothetical protein